jgi:hypothetical protein
MKTKLLYALLFICSVSQAQFPTNGLIAQYVFDNGTLLVDGANAQNFTQVGTALTEVNDRFNTAPTSAIKLNGDYLTFKGMVDTENTSAFAKVNFGKDTITIEGFEREPSRKLIIK